MLHLIYRPRVPTWLVPDYPLRVGLLGIRSPSRPATRLLPHALVWAHRGRLHRTTAAGIPRSLAVGGVGGSEPRRSGGRSGPGVSDAFLFGVHVRCV